MADEADHRADADACPPWCVRIHRPADHADDRLHQSEPLHLAVLVDRQPFLADADVHPERLVLRLARRPGSATTWLEVVAEERSAFRLVTTAESADRLGRSLRVLAAEAG
jgi:hypothetical protein